jgi:hypothetical protein
MTTRRSLSLALPGLFLWGALSACGSDGPTLDEICQARLPGDLVVSEFLANPSGTDKGNEWIELYNASGKDIDLAGLTLFHADAAGGGEKKHTFKAATIPAGGYFVAGDAESPPAWMQYSYGNVFGTGIRNTSGTLGVRCGAKVLDEVKYTAVREGRSLQLTGSVTPDSVLNDQEINWCSTPADKKYDGTNAGTPGARNETCGETASGSCVDPATRASRPIVFPAAGELVVTEVMADPSAVADGDGEWVEVLAKGTFDLNGLTFQAGSSKSTLTDPSCIRLTPGSYAVVARSDDSEVNGGLPQVDAVYGTALPNGAATLTITAGNTVIDEVSWAKARPGVAAQLSSAHLDATQNNDPASFCDAVATYGAGDKGTPRAENRECPPVVPSGTCLDPLSGAARSILTPAPGQLVVTEVMADPAKVADSVGEWVEVFALSDVDLNGLTFQAGSSKSTVAGADCIRVGAGTHAVVARSGDAEVNGGLPVVHALFGTALPNSTATLSISSGTTLIDQVSWTSAKAGVASQLSGDKLSAEENNDPANFCDAQAVYGLGDKGSPGDPNRTCPPVLPTGQCTDPDSGDARPIRNPAPGELVVTEVMADPSKVADTAGEWIEVYATADLDLNGLTVQAGSSKSTIVAGECRPVAQGSYAVLARSADPQVNGGLPAVDAIIGTSLPNSAATLTVHAGTTLIDSVSWTSTTAGVARQLSSDKLDAAANDDPASFCAATAPYGLGDKGSPGQANLQCPMTVPAGQCLDPSTGTVRPIVKPLANEVVVTEVMPDPSAVADAMGEWFEVHAVTAVDLNGLTLTIGTTDTPITRAECIRVEAGGFALFARSADPAANGGLPPVTFTFGTGLTNASGSVALRDGVDLLHQVTWTSSKAGVARQLDPARLGPGDNVNPAYFCDATDVYGAGDKGTPSAQNTSCP